ncbi:MAG TPA: hypothetical protein VN578_14210 [Candidatus Binatia bacterium]|jgi:hypothetical protein|nr:hypothetical protein [Candidatus Binatia bacterium]
MNPHNKLRERGYAARPRVVATGTEQADSPQAATASERRAEIKIGKAVVPRPGDREGVRAGVVAEVFTMTLGAETIQLLPLKNWSQLDVFKWRARGILPRTPAGLEITLEHLKVAGETVSTWDSDACAKLEKAFNNWLALESESAELAKKKARTPKALDAPAQPEVHTLRFQVQIGSAGRPRLRCLEGNETVKEVALNLQGFNAVIEQGLMRKPGALKVGALHDWVELDGELFRFQDGADGVRALEKALNERYVPAAEPGAPLDVAVFSNPASPTGFDIQFPATPHGLAETRRCHLNEESVELLQDPHRCRVLRKGTLARLSPPNLIFKRKTPDGGERYLAPRPENIVSAMSDDGQMKAIDLSRPVSLLNLGARELTAVLNHPAINRRARLAQAVQ